jgi:hypothetical protein
MISTETATATAPDKFYARKIKTAAPSSGRSIFKSRKDQMTMTLAPTLTRP